MSSGEASPRNAMACDQDSARPLMLFAWNASCASSCFFAAATKNIWIARLEAHHLLAFACQPDQKLIDVFLSNLVSLSKI